MNRIRELIMKFSDLFRTPFVYLWHKWHPVTIIRSLLIIISIITLITLFVRDANFDLISEGDIDNVYKEPRHIIDNYDVIRRGYSGIKLLNYDNNTNLYNDTDTRNSINENGDYNNDNIETKHHFLALDGISYDLCNTNFHLDDYYFQGHIIDESNMYFMPIGLYGYEERRTFQLCFANHNHNHMLKAQIFHHSASDIGDCDVYLSASEKLPSPTRWDWKSTSIGPDTINIYSFAREFQSSRAANGSLYISVYGKAENNKCSLGLEVISLPSDELLHKLGLRGGSLLKPKEYKDGNE